VGVEIQWCEKVGGCAPHTLKIICFENSKYLHRQWISVQIFFFNFLPLEQTIQIQLALLISPERNGVPTKNC
jgi:hypothetical protein